MLIEQDTDCPRKTTRMAIENITTVASLLLSVIEGSFRVEMLATHRPVSNCQF